MVWSRRSLASPATNDWSILSVLIGQHFRCCRQEYPAEYLEIELTESVAFGDRRITKRDRFGQLDFEILGGQLGISQHALYPPVEVRSHLARRNIDGQPERSPCQHSPVTHLAAGFAQHPSADFRHQAGRFDHVQELARWQ